MKLVLNDGPKCRPEQERVQTMTLEKIDNSRGRQNYNTKTKVRKKVEEVEQTLEWQR